MKVHLRGTPSQTAQGYSFEVGEHVFVEGRDGEFVVVEVDRNSQSLQLLPVRKPGRIERFPTSSVRIVLPPKTESSDEKEAKLDGFSDSPAA
ncbi:hypothetical protein [Occallatibacter riparius]|uniref:Uncharacterized protein n=1 Tax=Occallatibacter riparius TaxID=1002689 RepID=A0A9J7BVB0_9BACT|nr:hypothetical protein [Occallatibacter riparius]UWZ86560.1 hypothetical protein MOP44_11585 [Occallatibacter riparius]